MILVVIAVPSVKLIKKQYQPASDAAVTVKATGYQWYWTYTYPDNGGFEVVSNMLKEKKDVEPGQRFRTDADGAPQLAADNRMVVPVGEPIRLQTIGADVIHSFAIPSLWFKLDAVPGQINERQLVIKEPGVYYGQCSELCGVRHGYMPIVIEALPRDQFNRWVIDHGGKIEGAPQKLGTIVSGPSGMIVWALARSGLSSDVRRILPRGAPLRESTYRLPSSPISPWRI